MGRLSVQSVQVVKEIEKPLVFLANRPGHFLVDSYIPRQVGLIVVICEVHETHAIGAKGGVGVQERVSSYAVQNLSSKFSTISLYSFNIGLSSDISGNSWYMLSQFSK